MSARKHIYIAQNCTSLIDLGCQYSANKGVVHATKLVRKCVWVTMDVGCKSVAAATNLGMDGR